MILLQEKVSKKKEHAEISSLRVKCRPSTNKQTCSFCSIPETYHVPAPGLSLVGNTVQSKLFTLREGLYSRGRQTVNREVMH